MSFGSLESSVCLENESKLVFDSILIPVENSYYFFILDLTINDIENLSALSMSPSFSVSMFDPNRAKQSCLNDPIIMRGFSDSDVDRPFIEML